MAAGTGRSFRQFGDLRQDLSRDRADDLRFGGEAAGHGCSGEICRHLSRWLLLRREIETMVIGIVSTVIRPRM